MDLDTLVGDVKTRMSVLIAKPKMTEKLLSKPPFRFLHDIITSITTTTGFGEGLFNADELDAASITDKQAKINYLEKIFLLVSICVGSTIDVRAAKVVAGLEVCIHSILFYLILSYSILSTHLHMCLYMFSHS